MFDQLKAETVLLCKTFDFCCRQERQIIRCFIEFKPFRGKFLREFGIFQTILQFGNSVADDDDSVFTQFFVGSVQQIELFFRTQVVDHIVEEIHIGFRQVPFTDIGMLKTELI